MSNEINFNLTFEESLSKLHSAVACELAIIELTEKMLKMKADLFSLQRRLVKLQSKDSAVFEESQRLKFMLDELDKRQASFTEGPMASQLAETRTSLELRIEALKKRANRLDPKKIKDINDQIKGKKFTFVSFESHIVAYTKRRDEINAEQQKNEAAADEGNTSTSKV